MANISIFLAEGFETCEALLVVDLCRRAGLNIEMVSISDELTVTSSHKVPVIADKTLKDVDFDAQDMIVLPGGMPGTLNLEACEPLMAKLDEFYKAGKCISAVCAAPSIFGHRGYMKGREATSYPGFEEDLKDANYTLNPVAISDFITTSRGLGTSIDFGLSIVERFCGKEAADNLAHKIVYR